MEYEFLKISLLPTLSFTFLRAFYETYTREKDEAATRRRDANPQNLSQFGLESATRLHEAGFASNRASATARCIRSRALYTAPVKPWEPGVPEGRYRKGRARVRQVTGAKS